MQYILVESLKALDNEEACKKSFDWAARWVRSNFMAYKETQAMFEKVRKKKNEKCSFFFQL